MEKMINHEIANIGKINIALRNFSSNLFNELDRDNLIDYLKKQNHLGVLSQSHPACNHKRWDYVCLKLFLLNKLKNSSLGKGLSSKMKNFTLNNETISSEDFLQCWILLSNIGHLPGTVSSEKALLKFLKDNNEYKKEFLGFTQTNNKFEKLIKQVFDFNNYYRLKHLITINYLANTDLKQYISIIDKYMNSNAQKIIKLRNLYRKIRRISFIYIDSLNSDFPFQIFLNKLLLNIHNYEHLFNPSTYEYDNYFYYTEIMMSKKIYLSPESVSIHNSNCIDFAKWTKRKIQNISKKIEFRTLLKSISELNYKFPTSKEKFFEFYSYFSLEDNLPFFKFLVKNEFNERIKGIYKFEDEYKRKINQNIHKSNDVCLFHDNTQSLFFLIFFLNKFKFIKKDYLNIIQNMNYILLNIFEYFNIFHRIEDNDLKFFLKSNFQKAIVRKYFQFLLKILIKNDDYKGNIDYNPYIKYEFIQQMKRIDFKLTETVFSDSKMNFLKILEKYQNSEFKKDIKNNIKIIENIIKTQINFYSSRIFCSFLPIEIEKIEYNSSSLDKKDYPYVRSSVTDIDAIILVFNKSKFELFIIEGKWSKKGFKKEEIKKDLNKINSLFQFGSLFSKPKYIKNHGKGGFISLRNF